MHSRKPIIYQIIHIFTFILYVSIASAAVPSQAQDLPTPEPMIEKEENNVIIMGGGHLGLIEALLTHLHAKENGIPLRITIYEKNGSTSQTTAANIWNSHTPDEIVSVVPRGKELEEKLKLKFSDPGGVRVDDVFGVNDSENSKCFIEQVETYGQNENAHKKRTEALLKLGKASMLLWKQLYDTADDELKAILMQSNFNPCCEPDDDSKEFLHKGYRVDLIYSVPNAKEKASNMLEAYQKLGYKNCKILSPEDVAARDPSLCQFCGLHSTGELGKRQWNEDSIALWRPGGCLDTQIFLPKLADYLEKAMGTYVTETGEIRNCFQLKFNKKVTSVIFSHFENDQVNIEGLKFADGTQDENKGKKITYIFCPGESVGTLRDLGFCEPAYAGFAGASLFLNVPVSKNVLQIVGEFNHCMEVHKVGVVLAWQGRVREGNLFLGGAGTKAYYGNQEPMIDQEFAKNRNLLQLQMFNDVVPWLVSIALKRETAGQIMTEEDMAFLEREGIAKRWVGRRAVTYDGFPTLGRLYYRDLLVSNGRTTTHLSSGGGSFSLGTALVSCSALFPEQVMKKLLQVNLSPSFVQEVLNYADSRRKAEHTEDLSN